MYRGLLRSYHLHFHQVRSLQVQESIDDGHDHCAVLLCLDQRYLYVFREQLPRVVPISTLANMMFARHHAYRMEGCSFSGSG